jgi:hypothetical protein
LLCVDAQGSHIWWGQIIHWNLVVLPACFQPQRPTKVEVYVADGPISGQLSMLKVYHQFSSTAITTGSFKCSIGIKSLCFFRVLTYQSSKPLYCIIYSHLVSQIRSSLLDRRGSRRGLRRGSRRGLRVGTILGLKRGPRRGSRRGPRRGSRRGPRRGSRREPRRGLRRGPRRGSRRGSRKGLRRGS